MQEHLAFRCDGLIGCFLTDDDGEMLAYAYSSIDQKSAILKANFDLEHGIRLSEANTLQHKGMRLVCRAWTLEVRRKAAIARLRHPKRISTAIDSVLKAWKQLFKVCTPEIINHGSCQCFADDVKSIFPACKIVCAAKIGHTYLSMSGKYYDAECPEGTFQRSELPHFKRIA